MDNAFSSVNAHCMAALLNATESTRIVASEDILDDRGLKLWASGAEITVGLQERLMQRKLMKPLEASLAVEDGVTATELRKAAEAELIEPALALLARGNTIALANILAHLPMNNVLTLLMTAAYHDTSGSFQHSVRVAMLAGALASAAGKSGAELERIVWAGMVHDLGEMYIDPNYLHSKRVLTPVEWKHVAVHPRVGYLLLTNLMGYPKAIANAVHDHHERVNGSGYPRKLVRDEIAPEALFLSVAEAVTGLMGLTPDPYLRMCLALKLVPGEYPREILNLLQPLSALITPSEAPAGFDPAQAQETCIELVSRLEQASGLCVDLLNGGLLADSESRDVRRIHELLVRLRMALISTGTTHLGCGDLDAEMYVELNYIPYEVKWRTRGLARELALMLPSVGSMVAPKLVGLIGLLDTVSLEQVIASQEKA